MKTVNQEGPLGPSPLALSITGSPLFCISDPDTERESLFAGQNGAAFFDFVEVATFHLYAQDNDYWKAAEKLEDALIPVIVDYILDALELIGVTDEGVKAEVCRCVIKGGNFLDGKGFMEGRPVQPPAPKSWRKVNHLKRLSSHQKEYVRRTA